MPQTSYNGTYNNIQKVTIIDLKMSNVIESDQNDKETMNLGPCNTDNCRFDDK